MCDAIVVRGMGKRFPRYHQDRPSTLQEACQRRFRAVLPVELFWALRGVDFRLAAGRMLGVVGLNGAGKSTLLRLLGGIGRPDEGTVEVHGRIGALSDLGAGFQPDLTGRENMLISGVVNGLTRRQIHRRFDAIVAFAELEDFIDSPLRTYSSGMQMRLGFAVAVHSDADVLLIDEVLAVGDHRFRHKCLERILMFKKRGHSVVLVSHQSDLIKELCDEALWLQSGRVVAQGDVDSVIGDYLADANTSGEGPQAEAVDRT